MEKKSRDKRESTSPAEKQRELEAKKNLSRPPRDKTEVVIGPTDKAGPDVALE